MTTAARPGTSQALALMSLGQRGPVGVAAVGAVAEHGQPWAVVVVACFADLVAPTRPGPGLYAQDDGMAMHIGPDTAGRMMEVGTIKLRDGRTAIAHAMRPPRKKYINPPDSRR